MIRHGDLPMKCAPACGVNRSPAAGSSIAATIAGRSRSWQGVANRRAARHPRAGTRHLLVGAEVPKTVD
jgi:hypothetical protein